VDDKLATRPSIRVLGARQHNLKNIDVEIPRGSLTVITGLSGSGKSSLAFDTIFAEGQRRYVESLSAYARQFLEQTTIAIEQCTTGASPRSTVATTTEIYDYLRVLFARAGNPRCWKCGRAIQLQSTAQVVDTVLGGPEGMRIMVLAPLVQGQRGGHKAVLQRIAKEGFVRARIDGEVVLLEEIEGLHPNRKHTIEVVVDRLIIKPTIAQRLADSVELATRLAAGRIVITAETQSGKWSDQRFSAALSCPVHDDVRVDEISPQLFSFNSPRGACELCHGLGTTQEFDPELIVPDPNTSLAGGAIVAWRHHGKHQNELYAQMLKEFCERFDVLKDIPFRNIPKDRARILLHGTTDEDAKKHGTSFEGVIPNLKRRWQTTDSEAMKQRLHSFLYESPCEQCKGARLRPQALCVKIDDRSIAELTALTVTEALTFFESLTFSGESQAVAEPLLREINQRLRFMGDVGVDYLALDRASATLSGGEWQRIRLATQIGSGLAGICYVLDEPTIGLHARDSRRLVGILKRLTEMDNTVIVVEHDEEVIAGATHMIDVGPGAGARGGHLVAQGTLADVLAADTSVTAKYLTGKHEISLPDRRRPVNWDRAVELRGVTANNLKNITVRFPLGCFVGVTGVSGSGKSTLVTQVLVRVLKRRLQRRGPRPGSFQRIVGSADIDKVVEIDQSPIGRTPRSNPGGQDSRLQPRTIQFQRQRGALRTLRRPGD
jgi:excinuclease ABC subunit A